MLMFNLGIANGWKEKPDIVKKCEENKHHLTTLYSDKPYKWQCYHKVMCEHPQCQYFYEVDSSG